MDRVLVVWSAAKQRLDEKKRKTYLKRLLNQLAGAQQRLNTRRYKQRAYVEQRLRAFQQGNPAQHLVDIELGGPDNALTLTFRVNRARLAAAQALDGRYLLATNADHLSADKTLRLKGQDGVEKRFRGVKGPLAVHPLFVHQDRRIEGLVFITLVALLVRAILERAIRQPRLVQLLLQCTRGVVALLCFGTCGLDRLAHCLWRRRASQDQHGGVVKDLEGLLDIRILFPVDSPGTQRGPPGKTAD